MNKLEIENIINRSISMLLANDMHLLEYDVNERCITHKLGMYIEQLTNKYLLTHGMSVDCEYNKSECDTKRINMLISKWLECHPKKKKIYCITREKAVPVYPDIIIHKRGNNKNNLLCIEVKKSTNKDGIKYDEYKMEKYTEKRFEGLNYEYGVLINFVLVKSSNKKKFRYEDFDKYYFRNGKEIPMK